MTAQLTWQPAMQAAVTCVTGSLSQTLLHACIGVVFVPVCVFVVLTADAICNMQGAGSEEIMRICEEAGMTVAQGCVLMDMNATNT